MEEKSLCKIKRKNSILAVWDLFCCFFCFVFINLKQPFIY